MDVIATLELSEQEEVELSRILGIDRTALADGLRDAASAALREYATMFLGQRVFRRGSDISEHRLLLLVGSVFGNRIPDEMEVSRLFQTTASESRALIRAVMSKYQYQLRHAVETSMRAVVDGAEHEGDDGPYVVTVNSINVVEELNRLLASIDGSLQQVAKKRGSVSTYEIQPASYAALSGSLAAR